MVQIKIILILFIIFLAPQLAQAKVDAIICNGQLYSLDYFLINDKKTYGEIAQENDLPTGTFPYILYINTIFEKAAPELRPLLGLYFNNLKNETDFSQPMFWKGSGLTLPKETLLVKDWPALAPCSTSGKVEAFSIVQPIQQGQSIVFEYDQKLFSTLKTSNLQLSFLYMGTFLRLLSQDLNSLYNINGLIHSLKVIGLPEETLSDLFIKFGMKKASQTRGTCERSNFVTLGLQKSTGLPCEITTNENLLEVLELTIETDEDRVTWAYKNQDFKGLSNLKELTIKGFGYEVNKIPETELQDFKKLKKLSLTNLDTDVVPLNFMNSLTGLTHLDLSNNDIFEFKENVFRKVFIQKLNTDSKNEEVILDLSNNNSRWLPRKRVYVHHGTFNNCQAITKLLMNNMNITKLDGNVFSSLVSLKELDLSNNYINEFPWAVIELPKLEILHFCNPLFKGEKQKEILDELKRRGKKIEIKWCASR
jgi:Leucine-rich repeat (LRR) protein